MSREEPGLGLAHADPALVMRTTSPMRKLCPTRSFTFHGPQNRNTAWVAGDAAEQLLPARRRSRRVPTRKSGSEVRVHPNHVKATQHGFRCMNAWVCSQGF